MKTGEIDTSGAPITTLRGASLDVDVRRAGRLVVSACLAALGVLVIVFFLAGVHRNDQITRLREQGVAVQVTVSRCMGLIGGSGSNAAGYACRGTFTLDGHRYNDAIPGNTLYAPGATFQGVIVPSEPALLSTARAVATERASWKVFILPAILLAILVLFAGALALRGRPRV